MAKKKISNKHKIPIYIYDEGGAFSKENLGGTIGSLGSAASSIIGAGVSNARIADTRGIKSNVNAAKSYIVGATDNDALMSEWGTWSPMGHVSRRDIRGGNTGQRLVNTVGAVGSGASAGATVGGPIGAIVGGAAGLISGVAGWISGSRKARRKARSLNRQIDYANAKNLLSLENRADDIDIQNDLITMANYAANGGKIYIKPENRGKFTEYCGGKVTSECIAKGKRSSSPTIRKRATFAANARKWKHDDGGFLNWLDKVSNNINATFYSTHGDPKVNVGGMLFDPATHAAYADGGQLNNMELFSNNVKIIGNGRTHEQNPYDGVQIGVDSQGIPNMVEEGEVIFQDYVYSNRLKVPESVKKKYKFKGDTFADVAKNIQKESEERPNDPISKSGLEDSMFKLRIEQEDVRAKNTSQEDKNIFAGGGPAGINPDIDESSNNSVPATEDVSSFNFDPSWLRYAPIVGSGLGVIENLFSKPDYSNATRIEEAANKAGEYVPMRYTPIGNYLSYTPFDRNYYTSKLASQAGATRRAIINQSAGNRAAAIAGLLAADYNTQSKYGDLIKQAEEYNLAQRQAVEQFNRATNQANAEMGLQSSKANQVARQAANEARLKGITQAVALREEIDKQRAAARSANLTSLFDNLGALGKEEFIKEMIRENPAILYDWMGTYKGTNSSACGGYLTVKNKKRRK